MKTCGKCRRELPLSSFHRHGAKHQPWCKQCKSEYAADYYRRTRAVRVESNRRHRRRSYEWYFSLKANRPCADCGGTFHPVAMQWDHRAGTVKLGDVATLQRGRRSRLLAEIEKCELVCANCHAIRTYERRCALRGEPAYPGDAPR